MAEIIDKDGVMDGLNSSKESLNDFKNDVTGKVNNLKGQVLDAVSPVADNIKSGVKYVRDTDKKITGMISDYKSAVIDILDSFIDTFSFGYLNLNNFNDIISIGKNGINFDSDRLLKKISASVGFDVSSVSSICDGLVNNCIKELGDYFEYDLGRLITMEGGSFNYTGDFRSTEGMGILDILARDDSSLLGVVDVLGQTFFYNQLVKESVTYGYSDSYDGLFNNYAYEKDAKSAFLDSLSIAINNGDIDSIEKILDLLADDSSNVNVVYPNIVPDILSNYKFKITDPSEDYAEIRDRIEAIFIRLRGNNWNKRYSNSMEDYILDMELTSNIGIACETLFNTHDEMQLLICCKKMLYTGDAFEVLKSQLPTLIVLE